MHILIRPALFIVIVATAAAAATEPIIYQGRMTDGGTPPSGLYDMTIRAWTEPAGGVPVGNEFVLTQVPVDDGYFSLELDFGDFVLAAADRWIEMAVRPQGGSSWTFLTPRQPVRAVPRSTVADSGVHSVSVGPDLATNGDPQAVYITLSYDFLQRIADLENLAASQGIAITNLLNEVQALESEVDALTVDVAEAQGRIAAVEGITDSMELTSIDGYPSLVVEGVNIHLRNGLGGTSTDNGLGNFVLGYNESRADPADNIRTGSHIVVTGREQNYEGSSGFLGGYQNTLNADYGSILSGFSNEVYGLASAVVGGLFNTAGDANDPNESFYSVASADTTTSEWAGARHPRRPEQCHARPLQRDCRGELQPDRRPEVGGRLRLQQPGQRLQLGHCGWRASNHRGLRRHRPGKRRGGRRWLPQRVGGDLRGHRGRFHQQEQRHLHGGLFGIRSRGRQRGPVDLLLLQRLGL